MNRLAALALVAVTTCSTPPKAHPPAEPSPVAAPRPLQPPPEVLVARARELRAQGDVASAQAQLEAAFQASPGADEVRIELADLLVADGRDLAQAEALLAGVGRRGGVRLHAVLARLAEARGDDVSAEWEYAVALAAADDPEARLRRALALERLGRAGEAIAELEAVRAARPEDAVARSRLAERYESAGRLDEAEGEYRWLAEAQPERAAAWERLARFYERTGRQQEARVAAERARAAAGRQERALRPLLPSRR